MLLDSSAQKNLLDAWRRAKKRGSFGHLSFICVNAKRFNGCGEYSGQVLETSFFFLLWLFLRRVSVRKRNYSFCKSKRRSAVVSHLRVKKLKRRTSTDNTIFSCVERFRLMTKRSLSVFAFKRTKCALWHSQFILLFIRPNRVSWLLRRKTSLMMLFLISMVLKHVGEQCSVVYWFCLVKISIVS